MIACRAYDLPLRTPYEWARGRQERRRGVLVRLDAGDHVGWGEVAPAPDHPVDSAGIQAEAERLVTGLDPRDMDFLVHLDRRDPSPRVRCAISTAWWDAAARREGTTLAAALARATAWPVPAAAEVPCNALITGTTPDEVLAATQTAVRSGFTTLKLKLHGRREDDLARVEAVRSAAPGATLRLDANGSWPPDQALAHLEALEPFDVAYVEQPVPPAAERTLHRLTGAGLIDIALDESATDAQTVDRLLGAGIGDVVIVKPQRVGGPDRALAVVQAALRHDKPAVVTNSLETSIGVHAALHVASLLPRPIPACGLATSRFFAEDVARPPAVARGLARVPESPGLGVAA